MLSHPARGRRQAATAWTLAVYATRSVLEMGDPMVSDDLAALAAAAYIYGFPLVFDLQMVAGKTDMGMLAPAPFNSFSHASRLAGPDDRFVSINNDTIYSIAQVDVSGGPVLLRVPDAAGRYYVLQFVDAWTNNFAYVGRRTTGTAAGSFLLTPPRWHGTAPDGAPVIEFPTNPATIVGRWACDGPADLEAVRALQRGLALEPFGAPAPATGLPVPAAVPDELAFSSSCGPGCKPSPRLPRTRTTSSGSPPRPARPGLAVCPLPGGAGPGADRRPGFGEAADGNRPQDGRPGTGGQRDPAPAAPRHQQLAASPRRAVPAAHAPVPATAGHPGRHLQDPAHHQGDELTAGRQWKRPASEYPRAAPARVYDDWSGGKDNYAADPGGHRGGAQGLAGQLGC
jgi:hypothetical protein